MITKVCKICLSFFQILEAVVVQVVSFVISILDCSIKIIALKNDFIKLKTSVEILLCFKRKEMRPKKKITA
jgi:hypothetical protein